MELLSNSEMELYAGSEGDEAANDVEGTEEVEEDEGKE